MRRLCLAAILALTTGARGDWVGSTTCGTCHPKELAAWQATAHARSTAALRILPRCTGCHGTGDAPAGKAYFAEVGCEACHGAGAHYAEDDVMRDLPLARALGLADLSDPKVRAAVCARCHDAPSTRRRPIDLAKRAH